MTTEPSPQCQECGAPRVDLADSFCRKCGVMYIASPPAAFRDVVAEPNSEALAPQPRLPKSVEHAAFGVIQHESPLQEPYIQNPFHVLGLSIGASSLDVRNASSRLQIQMRLRGAVDAEESLGDLSGLQAELLDPSKRPAHEARWFYEVPIGLDRGVIQDTSSETLDSIRASDDPISTIEAHDTAALLIALACHATEPASAQELLSLGIRAWDSWRGRSDFTSASVGSEQFWQWAVGFPVSLAAERNALAGNYLGVLAFDQALQEDSAAGVDITATLKPASERLAGIVRHSLSMLDDTDEDLQSAESLTKQAGSLIAELSPISRVSRELNEGASFPIAKSLDHAASKLRSISIALHNTHGDSANAISAMVGALQLATDAEFLLVLRSDERNLRYLYGMKRAITAFEAGNLSNAAELVEQTAQYASDAEERATVARFRSGLHAKSYQSQSFPWGWLVTIGVVILVVIIAVAIGSSGSESRNGASTSSGQSSSASESRSSQRSQISALASQVETLEADLQSLNRQSESICDRYREAGTTCTVPTTQYNQLKTIERQYDAKYAEYETKLAEHNRLVDLYNR